MPMLLTILYHPVPFAVLVKEVIQVKHVLLQLLPLRLWACIDPVTGSPPSARSGSKVFFCGGMVDGWR